ncbi:ATP-binding protein [Burkholderia reimsis]|uniref:ATP-binding protein n=1 Tax=Burkholderia reimsis TaxID=2234132 RepID=A0A365R092_9BURK|nr:ATP-binding protein [Burkholderia reimsis]RBB41748.1 ATP-binding protein [Burkholderia reimsis]
MTIRTATFDPAKRFFVEMLTRDIELQDAILDLLDNCVDGAMRLNDGQSVDGLRPYERYEARISFDASHFSISDNCGGISMALAERQAFRLGRPGDRENEDLPTVGVYGIGMKRAIFKMGEEATVRSRTHDGEQFCVEITPAWLRDDKSWNLPIIEESGKLDAPGTSIVVRQLRDGIARLFSNETDFEGALKKAIAAYYGYIIEKGFSVYVNNEEIQPNQVSLMFNRETFDTETPGMAPYAYRSEIDGVTVQLAIGMYRALPDEEEENDALEGKPTKELAGWTIICNDRVVLYADKSRVTGWGDAGVPQYHTQFVSISGIVVFKSNDASKLPLTTTKRGIDGNSELYLGVKEYMREGLKLFTDFTYKWKRASPERTALKTATEAISIQDIATLVPESRWNAVRRGGGGERFKPTLPMPKEDDPSRQIRFSKRVSEIRKVSEYLFGDEDVPAGDVGAKCFDEMMKKAKV